MNSNANWDLRVDGGIYKALKKVPSPYARKITETIRSLSYNPYLGDIQKIKGEKFLWRRRIGDYRIFFEIYQQQKRIEVRWIERKTSKT